MRALIVDDEVHAREELADLLSGAPDVQVVGKCANAVEALQVLRQERPDVLFLDVNMPGVSGFELLAMVDDELLPDVVFVTAHEDYALKAFEERAVDYLLKPVEEQRLAKTLERLRRGRDAAPAALAAPAIERIPCLAARSIKLVPVREVEFVKSSEAGVYVVTAQGEFHTELTLTVLEARAHLLRCHKQFLVNLDRIDEISMGENSVAVIKTRSGTTVPVSRRYLAKLRATLGL
jgi:two-component system LytT family response regulator